jgi:hypothetical protein
MDIVELVLRVWTPQDFTTNDPIVTERDEAVVHIPFVVLRNERDGGFVVHGQSDRTIERTLEAWHTGSWQRLFQGTVVSPRYAELPQLPPESVTPLEELP